MNTKMQIKLASALAIALGAGALAHAQTPPNQNEDLGPTVELEAFQVTGSFAGNLAAATEIKQRATVVVEAISAEDIGKLPDTSIAESLARLPGLTTQRVNSRAQSIVIRSLTGDFSTALLNGRQQVSSGSNRSVEFDQYPAELLNGVVVYKTTAPNLVGQGLAGTVDMRTVRPLDRSERAFAANIFYEWTDLKTLNPDGEDSGLRYSFNYIDQFKDGKLGIAFGYAHTDQPGQGEEYNAWGYPTIYTNNLTGLPTDQATDANGQPNVLIGRILGGGKPFIRSSNLERDGFMGVVEFKPNDNFHSTLDLFYSEFAEIAIRCGNEWPFWWGNGQLQPGYRVENGLVVEATFNNQFGVARNDVVWRDAKVYAAGWNMEAGEVDSWQFEADLSYSRIDRKDNNVETYSGYGSNQMGQSDSVTYTLRDSNAAIFDTVLDYSDASLMRLTSPQGWGGDVIPGGQLGFFKGPESNDELSQLQVAARHPLSNFLELFNSLELGAAYTDRDKSEFEAGLDGREGWFLSINGAASAPLPPLIGTANLGYVGIGPQIAYDPRAALNTIYDRTPNENPALLADSWGVEEKVLTLYGQMGLEAKVGMLPVTGTLGTQLVFSDQKSFGPAATLVDGVSQITDVGGSHDYYDIVPSLNFAIQLAEGKSLRISVARQLARQAMRDMRASSTYSFNEQLADSTDVLTSPWSGSGGNPKLEPWRSNSVDISYENYFKDNKGYWALAGYYKDLRTYTFNQRVLTDFTGFPTGSPLTPALNEGYRTTPQNGSGGKIKGLELTISVPGEIFTDTLSGFGIILSGSYTTSSITPDPGNPSQPIPGLSEKVVNGTFYFEKKGFAARVSTRFRSDYRGDIATFGARGTVFRNVREELVVDAQLSYSFASGPLEGLTLLLQGYNLTDEPLFATEGDQDTRLVQDYQLWGAQYSVGASYKF